MTGTRRTAALAAAFLLLTSALATAEAPTQHVLRTGTAVVFVTDAPLETGRRDGDVVTIHLRDPLVFDGAVLAPAGTHAVILVGIPTGAVRPVYTLDRFYTSAGLMPLHTVSPIVPPLAAGAEIAATTGAEVDHLGDRFSVRVPFPFRLSGDAPASSYTPTPARTAPPYMPAPRRGRGLPSPTPVPATPSPASSASPDAPSPSPDATKIPSR